MKKPLILRLTLLLGCIAGVVLLGINISAYIKQPSKKELNNQATASKIVDEIHRFSTQKNKAAITETLAGAYTDNNHQLQIRESVKLRSFAFNAYLQTITLNGSFEDILKTTHRFESDNTNLFLIHAQYETPVQHKNRLPGVPKDGIDAHLSFFYYTLPVSTMY